MLALVEEVGGGAFSLARVWIRLEVVDDRVGVRRRLPLGTAGGFPGGGLFVFPLLDHRVARVSQELGSHHGETVGVLSFHGLALAVPPYNQLALLVKPRHGPPLSFGVANACNHARNNRGTGRWSLSRGDNRPPERPESSAHPHGHSERDGCECPAVLPPTRAIL